MAKKTCIIYNSWGDIIRALPAEMAGELTKAILAYAFDGEEPEIDNPALAASFAMMRKKLDEDSDSYNRKVENLNKNKAGQKEVNQNSDRNQTEIEQNSDRNQTEIDSVSVSVSVSDSVSDSVSGKDKKSARVKPIRHKYGEYDNVLLSDEERDKLINEFPDDWKARVDNLSGYMKSTGKKYSDHLATIRNWAKRDNGRASPVRRSVSEEMSHRFDPVKEWMEGSNDS